MGAFFMPIFRNQVVQYVIGRAFSSLEASLLTMPRPVDSPFLNWCRNLNFYFWKVRFYTSFLL